MSANQRIPPVKTERSHEENQERAYIAASRRADRSLEARVQSARQASEIHRRRTGRGLKVSEEIVLKEEMYEEEEDDLPRHYKFLTAHLQTNSPDMNHRVNAYITTQTAMATMARYQEINRLFSESFPTAMTNQQQQLNSSAYMASLMNNDAGFSNRLSISGSSQDSSATRTHSVSSQSLFDGIDRRGSATIGSPAPNSATTISSPPALTPGSTSTDADAAESKATPFQTPSAFPPLHLDPQLAQQSTSSSAFTSELPNEVKMMANIDMNDPMAMHFMGDPSTYQMFGPFPGDSTTQDENSEVDIKQEVPTFSPHEAHIPDDDIFPTSDNSMTDNTFNLLDFHNEGYDQIGTPVGGTGGDGSWESFVDFGSEQ
ncbi:uncharacterized protein F4807DRAFT_460036 [Annulohypoxylon truncatum]|uniref:uncharacterized protein n=1 Tax=Annulohypoxylon truncatum TaxID=327061 RepID=UPI0020087F7A|nr:uncharacterized protein F4807DRAFT_460036 [Annulohypoxylon truncatum]KAI1210204.1 hypothetical protein F4807DRAFT_460036 [Annulohypoxylon truncatum]